MKSFTHLPLSVLALSLALVGCKKNDPTPDGAGSASAPPAALVAIDTKGFEGEIDVLMKPADATKPPTAIALLVKNAKIRFDMPKPDVARATGLPGQGGYVIVDAPAKKMSTVLDAQRQVITVSLDQLSEQLKAWKSPSGAASPTAGGKVTKTGRTEVVAGISCEDWDVASTKGDRAQLCVASQSASWFQVPSLGLTGDQSWAQDLFDGEHLPLRVISYDTAGAEEGRIEVTKLEKKPLADSLFELPAGYRQTDLGAMLKSVFGGGAMPMAGMPGMPPGMPAQPGMPGAAPSAATGAPLPPGMALPPGMTLPPGVHLPPGMQLPPGLQLTPAQEAAIKQMQDRARAMAAPAPTK